MTIKVVLHRCSSLSVVTCLLLWRHGMGSWVFRAVYTGTRPGVFPAIRAGKGWRGRRELAPRCSATRIKLHACSGMDKHTSVIVMSAPPPPPTPPLPPSLPHTPHHTTPHHTTPHHTTPHHTTTQHNTTQHNTTQHNTTQHNTTQRTNGPRLEDERKDVRGSAGGPRSKLLRGSGGRGLGRRKLMVLRRWARRRHGSNKRGRERLKLHNAEVEAGV